jgi:D-alanyl-D-alanine carboxypeptidase
VVEGKLLRKFRWVNTNQLLKSSGYLGVKTGVTEAAGPCLSGCYKKNGHFLIIVLLNSRTMDDRWKEVTKLVEWVASV